MRIAPMNIVWLTNILYTGNSPLKSAVDVREGLSQGAGPGP